MKLLPLLLLFSILHTRSYAQELLLLKGPYLENLGYWKDSLIYDMNGEPFMKIRGTMVINKQGKLAGWTDHSGIFYGKDGYMRYYTVKMKKKAAEEVVLQPGDLVIPEIEMPVFEPVRCYAFLPLVGLEFDDLANSRKGESKFIITEKSFILPLHDRAPASGVPFTEKDSILALLYMRHADKERPRQVGIRYYNRNDDRFAEAERSYMSAREAFDSAYARHALGNYKAAMEWAYKASRIRRSYLNAYLLGCSSAARSKDYGMAFDILKEASVVFPAYNTLFDAFRGELYALMGEKDKARKMLRNGFYSGGREWAVYFGGKYGIPVE